MSSCIKLNPSVPFSSRVNRAYRRTGTLWEGRYKSSLIDSDAYLLTCMRYIELNPVRARMVNHPGEYCWSSYAANAMGRTHPLLTAHPVYEQLGIDGEARSARVSRALPASHGQ